MTILNRNDVLEQKMQSKYWLMRRCNDMIFNFQFSFPALDQDIKVENKEFFERKNAKQPYATRTKQTKPNQTTTWRAIFRMKCVMMVFISVCVQIFSIYENFRKKFFFGQKSYYIYRMYVLVCNFSSLFCLYLGFSLIIIKALDRKKVVVGWWWWWYFQNSPAIHIKIK